MQLIELVGFIRSSRSHSSEKSHEPTTVVNDLVQSLHWVLRNQFQIEVTREILLRTSRKAAQSIYFLLRNMLK